MNEVIQTILERRSVRKYLPDALKKEDIDAIVDCGLWAPSASNKQDWHVTVITDKKRIDQINDKYKEWMSGHRQNARYDMVMSGEYHVFFNAPCLVLISRPEESSWSETNAGNMAENMCLAAESLGIGNCQIGLPLPMLRSEIGKDLLPMFRLPEDYVPHLFISLGYPDKSVISVKKPRREGTVTYLES